MATSGNEHSSPEVGCYLAIFNDVLFDWFSASLGVGPDQSVAVRVFSFSWWNDLNWIRRSCIRHVHLSLITTSTAVITYVINYVILGVQTSLTAIFVHKKQHRPKQQNVTANTRHGLEYRIDYKCRLQYTSRVARLGEKAPIGLLLAAVGSLKFGFVALLLLGLLFSKSVDSPYRLS